MICDMSACASRGRCRSLRSSWQITTFNGRKTKKFKITTAHPISTLDWPYTSDVL